MCQSFWPTLNIQPRLDSLVGWKQAFVDQYSIAETWYNWNEDNQPSARSFGILTSPLKNKLTILSSGLKRGKEQDFINPGKVFIWTKNARYSWFVVVLPEKTTIHPTHYRLVYGSSGNFCCPRNWVLQATNDPSALTMGSSEEEYETDTNWETLRS